MICLLQHYFLKVVNLAFIRIFSTSFSDIVNLKNRMLFTGTSTFDCRPFIPLAFFQVFLYKTTWLFVTGNDKVPSPVACQYFTHTSLS